MSRTFMFVLLSVCFLMPATPSLASDQQDQAVAAAKTFSSIIDDGNVQAAYWSGSELLRAANDEQEWINRTERTLLLLGKVEQRTLKAVRSVNTYPGLPDDDYVIVYFEARTTRKTKAAEVLLIHQESGMFQVCSYSIR